MQVFLPQNHKGAEKTVEGMYFECLKRFDQGRSIPLLDPINDMEIESKTLSKLSASRQTIVEELSKSDIKDLNPA